MFGKKVSMDDFQELKNEFEACEEIVKGLSNKEKDLKSARFELQESRKQMDACLKQIGENMEAATEMAHDNVEAGHDLLEQISNQCQNVSLFEEKRADLENELDQMHQTCMELVESNKHYTDISKNMTEATEKLLAQDASYQELLEGMTNLGKEMGVVALNSAIEAGRLGDSGKQFVAAAEEVRLLAGQYEASVNDLKEQLKEHDDKIHSLEEEVKRLIGLLKDSNMASSKLMKRSGQAMEASKALANHSIVTDMEAMKTGVSSVCSSEEEVAKMQERNRMQLADIEEELKTQDNYITEMDGIVNPAMEEIIAYTKRRENNE